ncbi:MAG: 2-oxoglutarate dehydrogenase complex dihydrolipoyllysine-residue succinyltransferase [Calditrichaeota bacterium]|nr:2-oxoglutarate dehydrogenase complex dihydrolipoyllysine-residue succinyltransferase [Calditrichota bacterium]
MKVRIKVPEVGESITEVTIGQWLKPDGAYVERDEPVCEIESEKATFEVPAEESGVLKILVKEGETVRVGDVIGEIDTAGKAEGAEAGVAEAEAPVETRSEPAPEASRQETVVKVSPVAARILAEAGISPADVKGTGAGGRITKEDALRAVAEKEKASRQVDTGTKTAPKEAPPTVTDIGTDQRRTSRERMSTLRQTISRRLVAAKNETAMLTTFNEVDMSEILRLRKAYRETFQEKFGIRLGFMSFFVKACTIALKEFPAVNAQIDGTDIVYHDYCDIGIAVSTDRGLVVPVIRNAERLSLAEIEKEVARLAEKARQNKLTIEEMSGGTFTITNGGVFGSLLSTPLLNYPQSAILGMHKIQERPVVIDGEIGIRPMMYVALSYDHRIIDGRESVRFLVRVKELLEDPTRMLLNV